MDASMVYQSALSAALAAPVDTAADWVKGSHGFARIATSDRGAVYLKNAAERLREFAGTVRKNWAAYGGGAKPAEFAKPRKPRATAWPTVTVKVWRELIEAGEFSDAFALGAEKLGQLVYSGGRAAFAIVAPQPVEGLPADFASGRRDDGRYVVFDTVSGVAIGARGEASRKAAEESALILWADRTEEQHAQSLRSARSMYDTAPDVARAAWCAEHGIDCAGLPIAPAADPAAARHSFDIHLITAAGPDSAGGHRITYDRFTCAGPGLTSDDIRGANSRLREMAAAHGSRVVMEGFSDGGARAWCEPIAPAAPDDAAIAHAEFEASGACDAPPVDPHPLAQSSAKLAELRAKMADNPGKDGFYALTIRAAESTHEALAAAFAVFDAIGDGAELSTADGRRYCVLLPDASEPGRYRYQMFDARGFYSHSSHDTAAAAVADAARAGFTVAAPGILDRLAATQEWAHGSEVAAVMQQHNFGRLSWQDACAEFDRLAAVYAKPAGPEPETAPAEPIAQDAPPDIEPAAPIASRAPGRLAAGNIRPHRAAIAQHRAGRLAATPRGAVHSIGRAAWPGRGAPPAAPGPGVRAAAGAGPPG